MLDVKKIRKDFPMLDNKIMQGHKLVYFDSAATSLKPKCVIEAMNDYYFNYNSNVHRGDYDLAAKADSNYEKTRLTLAKFLNCFDLPAGTYGCTGSLVAGLECGTSDIDMVVYGSAWFKAREQLMKAVADGKIPSMSEEMWQKVYKKRQPDISFDDFVLHESRKFNRGEFEGTYFDLLYSRGYDNLHSVPPITLGEKTGKMTIEAKVTDASLAFDSPGIYKVDHEEIDMVLSFTHTYCGQCFTGETLEAKGIVEEHGDQKWLIVGTTREAHGEYIVSRTLLDA